MQIISINKVIKFVNFLNLELNFLLKPKKEKKSNMTIYLWNSFIKEIVDMLRIRSQGKLIKIL